MDWIDENLHTGYLLKKRLSVRFYPIHTGFGLKKNTELVFSKTENSF